MTAPWAALVTTTGGPDVPGLLLTLAAVLAATKVLGALARRIGQSAVLGELVAGVVLGPSVFGVLNPSEPVVYVLGEIGVLVLLFAMGLETDLGALRRMGREAMSVGAAGFVLPLAGGLGVALAFGASRRTALALGLVLIATSVGVSARVLRDLGRQQGDEARIARAAAVFDDVFGLVMLSIAGALVAGGGITTIPAARAALVVVGCFALVVVAGAALMRPLMALIARWAVPGAAGAAALAFAFVSAALSVRAGSATLLGAFAAGLALHRTPQRIDIERWTMSLGHVLVPVFLALVGAQVDLRALVTPSALGLTVALIAVAVAGKVAAGYAPRQFDGNKLLLGAAMVPGGDVGLIFAQMAVATGVLAGAQFGAVIAMIVVTTLLTPPLLGAIAGQSLPGGGDDDETPSLGELVSEGAPRQARATVPRRKMNE